MTISVCMATYNGGSFVYEQVSSILMQIGVHDELIIVDDGSTDDTIKILESLGDKRIKLFRNAKNLGVVSNFSKALSLARGDYLFLSDQDDVWAPDKIEKSLSGMLHLEQHYSDNMPLLVHTDLKLVDQDLKLQADSFWTENRFNIDKCQEFPRLLIQNVVTGCTCMINRALKDLALPIPESLIMHDWWLALVASSQGHIYAVRDQKVLYRQHSSNVLGAQPWLKYVISRLLRTSKSNHVRESVDRAILQATVFRNKYYVYLDDDKKKALDVFCNLMSYGFLAKRYYLVKYRFFKSGFVRNFGLFLLV